jgi:hypothetical protein
MSDYIFVYRLPGGGSRTAPSDETRGQWEKFLGTLGDRLVQIGDPVFSANTVGAGQSNTMLSGYSIVRADSLDQASKLAEGCPALSHGGAVEVGEITPLTM